MEGQASAACSEHCLENEKRYLQNRAQTQPFKTVLLNRSDKYPKSLPYFGRAFPFE